MDSTLSDQKRSDPYFIQIGLDFGTSYTKCVCRDMMLDRAWVHIHPRSEDQELPFLIPSTLIVKDNRLSLVDDIGTQYPEHGLFHLKSALVFSANGDGENPLLDSYRNSVRLKNSRQFPMFVQSCGVYYLAGVLGEIKKQIRSRFPDFGHRDDDYIAVNMAVPVENAEQPAINRLFIRMLSESLHLSDPLAEHPSIHFRELISLRKETQKEIGRTADSACYVYPEVSANVQGFVRSRVSSPGVYLFSDTGAGTVDQSIFIFIREDKKEHLTYLAARVLQAGSSQIERLAAAECGETDCFSLEKWRERKETGVVHAELKSAQHWVLTELQRGTESTLAHAKKKLIVRQQINTCCVIFGGGGHCEYPYKKGLLFPFSGHLFQKDVNPNVIGMPIPKDLELENHGWMRRLNVAYGLSFHKSELTSFTYPRDTPDPSPLEIWNPTKPIGSAPTKDEC
jgi:hypothetical protein